MLQTRPTRYKVVRGQNNYLWLEAIEGENAGTRVSVPRRNRAYDGEVQERVAELSPGDVCRATLESDSIRNPEWRIESVVPTA